MRYGPTEDAGHAPQVHGDDEGDTPPHPVQQEDAEDVGGYLHGPRQTEVEVGRAGEVLCVQRQAVVDQSVDQPASHGGQTAVTSGYTTRQAVVNQ